MEGHPSFGRVARYALILGVACLAILGVSYARYVQEVQGAGAASVAAVALDLTGGSGKLDVTERLKGMKPGDARTVAFSVAGYEAGAASEVAQEYSVSVETTGNLPLSYGLAAGEPVSGEGSLVQLGADGAGADLVWTGGLLPYGSVSHAYVLTVTWPSERADESLADEIDLVVLRVDAHQTMAGEAS